MLNHLKCTFVICTMLILVACKVTEPEKASVTISANEEGAAVTEPVNIYLNSQKVATTDIYGNITLDLDPGHYHLRASIPSRAGTELDITVAAGESQSLDLALTYGYATEPASMNSPQIVNHILPMDFTEFELHIVHDYPNSSSPLQVLQYSYIEKSSRSGYKLPLENFFEITPEGTIRAKDIEELRYTLDTFGAEKLSLVISALDKEMASYDENIEFYLGYHTVNVQLAAAPSNPNLPLDGLTVNAHYMGDSNIVLTLQTDANGRFKLNNLPSGNWHFNAKTRDGEWVYSTSASVMINQDKNLNLNMLTVEDIFNDIPFFSISNVNQTLSSLITVEESVQQERQILHKKINRKQKEEAEMKHQITVDAEGISVSVKSGTIDVPYTDKKVLVLPKGTSNITLLYTIMTDEYPYYVTQQSIYNDAWEIRVFAQDGDLLFGQFRQVNSQLYGEPKWQSNGSTGQLVKTFDVSHLTNNSDVNISLVASATNIGDSILPTRVIASLNFTPVLNITSVTNKGTPEVKGGMTNNVSIPRSGSKNTYVKVFQLELEKPLEVELLNISASLLQHGNSHEVMTVVDEPVGVKVASVNDTTLDVIVSMDSDYPSTVSSRPPNFHTINYKFKVEAEINSKPIFAEKESGQLHALWRMPDGLNRFGKRDQGGDDWATKGTYEWLKTYSELITAINDISGEHGRWIGHKTHINGTDIDIYHFTDLLGNRSSGGGNFATLRQYTANALNGDAKAKDNVTTWIKEARAGIDNLVALASVRQVISGSGRSGNGLPRGWLRTLMKTGQLTVGEQVLNIDLDIWSNMNHWKIIYNIEHDTHIHITLDSNALNKVSFNN